jgi:phenylalanyl-tRNA synthetase beta chain
MRTTTIPEVLSVLSINYNRRIEDAGIFEISRVYIPKVGRENELPEEIDVLTIGMYGDVDYYALKGIIEELMNVLGIKNCKYLPQKENPIFHPGRAANLIINGQEAGILGEIHPEVVEKFECAKRTYVAVIETNILIKNASLLNQFKPLPKFPAVSRDIAMLVKDEVLAAQIEEVIRVRAGKILEDIKLFDVYKGAQVPEGMKSVAYSMVFRANDRTLTDEEVGKAMAKVIDGLERNLAASLRE